jgi:hypothetical protein
LWRRILQISFFEINLCFGYPLEIEKERDNQLLSQKNEKLKMLTEFWIFGFNK